MRLKPRGRARRPAERSWRLLYATDFHAGDVVLRKFLNAVSVYEANVAVIGGDLTGKRLAPVVAQAGSWRAEVLGREQTAADEDELEAIVRSRIVAPAGEAVAQESLVEQDACEIPRERPTGPVGAAESGGQSDDEQTGAGRTE